jgi:DNA-directed RNA polymerase subunit RPC12/RpoP
MKPVELARMKPRVTRVQIIARGLGNRCPNCGARSLFEPGRPFRLRRACGACGLVLERDEGGFLGAMSLNYVVTICLLLLPVLAAYLLGWLGGGAAAVIAGVGAVLFPALFYRSSRSWWLMNYYLVLPHHLPANQRRLAADEDANT